MYVSDAVSNSVLRFNGTTGALVSTFVAAGAGGLSAPVGMVFGRDGNLLVVSSGSNQVKRYNGTTGAFIDNFVSTNLNSPWQIRIGPVDKDLYVSNSGDSSVVRFHRTTGSLNRVFVASGSGGLNAARSMVFGPANNLYVASANNNSVRRYDGTTGAFQAVHATIVNGAANCGAFTFANRRDVIVAQENAAAVPHIGIQIDEVSGASQTYSPNTSTANPIGAAFGIEGHYFTASQLSNTVIRHRPDGTFVDIFVAAGLGGLSDPIDIAVGQGGNLYVASRLTNSVKRYDQVTGAFLGDFATGVSGSGARDMTFGGPNNDLFVSNASTNQIMQFNGSTGALITATFTSGQAISGPWGVTFNPVDGNLYVLDRVASMVRRFNGTTGVFISNFVTTNIAGATQLGFGADGNLYVADQGADQVDRFNGTTGVFIATFGVSDNPNTIDFLGPRTAVGGVPVVTADLAVVKTADVAAPREADTVNYLLTITNNGPNNATNVVITDLLPTGVTFVLATPSQGAYVPGTGVWTVGAINNAANATLGLRVTVDAGQSGNTITNTTASLQMSETDPSVTDSIGSVRDRSHRIRPRGDQDRRQGHAD